jgi:hypothetical protein
MRRSVFEAGADQAGGMAFRVEDKRRRRGRSSMPRGCLFERGRIGQHRFFQCFVECVRRFAQRCGTKLTEDSTLIGCDAANSQ